jgi:hypothetical protein
LTRVISEQSIAPEDEIFAELLEAETMAVKNNVNMMGTRIMLFLRVANARSSENH